METTWKEMQLGKRHNWQIENLSNSIFVDWKHFSDVIVGGRTISCWHNLINVPQTLGCLRLAGINPVFFFSPALGEDLLISHILKTVDLRSVPSGKQPHNYGKSPFSMGKSTISTESFSIAMLNYQRVTKQNLSRTYKLPQTQSQTMRKPKKPAARPGKCG